MMMEVILVGLLFLLKSDKGCVYWVGQCVFMHRFGK
jgi:uncharacterized membrane protein